jgi:DNA helicase II / ATP-dependent DNA helicase PcrA
VHPRGPNLSTGQLSQEDSDDVSGQCDDGVRARLAERVKYVIVDEYQDVNPVQEAIVWTLHELGARICVVGDDDQNLYQWRGSDVENILTFDKRYPGVEQIPLEENFRSSEGVVETARAFIAQNSARLTKAMKPTGAQPYESGDIVALSFADPEAESRYIVETIQALRGVAFREDEVERGLSWSDMAVLLRSAKANAERPARLSYVSPRSAPTRGPNLSTGQLSQEDSDDVSGQ